jgi:hypothetical protein
MGKLILLLAVCLAILSVSMGSASLAIYEVGKAAICIEDKFEKANLGGFLLDTYPTIYFEPVTSREQVKNNEYNFFINKVNILNDRGFIEKPIWVMISDNPFNLDDTFSFDPQPVKIVPVGRLSMINTTLYNGSWEEQTPHVVTFTQENFSCCIYSQDIRQDAMEALLKRIDVVNKNDLVTLLPVLWTNE